MTKQATKEGGTSIHNLSPITVFALPTGFKTALKITHTNSLAGNTWKYLIAVFFFAKGEPGKGHQVQVGSLMQIQMQILLEATLLVYFLNHIGTLKIMTCILEKQWNYFKPMVAFSSLTKLSFQINSEHIANIFPLQWSFRGNLLSWFMSLKYSCNSGKFGCIVHVKASIYPKYDLLWNNALVEFILTCFSSF